MTRLASLLIALVATTVAVAQEIPPQPLVDLAAPAAVSRFAPSSPQVHVSHSTDPAGIAVQIDANSPAYPGVRVTPEGTPSFNLANYGRVEAKVTNTGDKTLRLNLRVDNAPADGEPTRWNCEIVNVAPGASATAKVIFGYAYGFRPAYPIKPDRVSAVLLFTEKSDAAQSFRIDSLVAAGPPGEKPASTDQRIKPTNGVLVGEGVVIDPKQLQAPAGATATPDKTSVSINASPGAVVSIKPLKGFWHLGNHNALRLTLRNTGASAITPTVRLSGGGDAIQSVGEAIPPGVTGEVVVPFDTAKAWEGKPAAERKGNHDAKPGTGTQYASDKTDAVQISVTSDQPASYRVESVRGEVLHAQLPDWLGKRPPVDGDWKVTFQENFDGTSVDTTRWNNSGPNYWDKVSHWSRNNVVVADGVAKLRYERKTGFHNDDPSQKQTDLTSGYLDTFDKFRQRYGYFESRIKLPTASGLWPAFWMMPDRGPNSGDKPGSKALRCSTADSGMEFDILEHLTVWGPHRYNIAMHWDNYGPDHKALGSGKIYIRPDADGFVTTGLLWLPGQAIFYCNGREIGRWEDPRVSSVPQYIIFTLVNGGWDGNVFDGTGVPDELVIDYVRVWQRADLTETSP